MEANIYETMPAQYRLHVETKIAQLQPVAVYIHRHLQDMCASSRYEISPEFRLKDKIRIAEKDRKDYDGRIYGKCLTTRVKDLFAARICPSCEYKTAEVVKNVKTEIRNELLKFFDLYSRKCVLEDKWLTIEERKMKISYFTIKGHIELQVCSLDERRLLEDDHDAYEDRRAELDAPVAIPLTGIPRPLISTGHVSTNSLPHEDLDLNASFDIKFKMTFDVDIATNLNHFIRGSRDWMHEV